MGQQDSSSDFEIDYVIKTRKNVQQARIPILIASKMAARAKKINWYCYFIRNIDYTL